MTRRLRLAQGIAAGCIAGLTAAWLMNLFQKGVTHFFDNDEKPHGAQSQQEGSPSHGAGAALRELGLDDPGDNAAERTANYVSAKLLDKRLSEPQKHVGGAVVHYVFGVSTGALYGAVSELFPQVGKGAGLPFGAVLWLVADEIVVPGLGLSKSAKDYPPSTHVYALSSHLFFAFVTHITLRGARVLLSR